MHLHTYTKPTFFKVVSVNKIQSQQIIQKKNMYHCVERWNNTIHVQEQRKSCSFISMEEINSLELEYFQMQCRRISYNKAVVFGSTLPQPRSESAKCAFIKLNSTSADSYFGGIKGSLLKKKEDHIQKKKKP